VSRPYRYDDLYRETVTLRDGSEALLRLVRPEDKPLLLDGFERMSPESRYYRFFTSKERLSEADLHYLTEIDGENHFAVGAVRIQPDGTQLGLGVARFVRLKDEPKTAEPAITVADDAQGKGLGTLLLHRLVDAAAERGIRHFRSVLLADNASMKRLLEDLSDGGRRRRCAGPTCGGSSERRRPKPSPW
jgi:GNAT superfamily N-acetyltransferase